MQIVYQHELKREFKQEARVLRLRDHPDGSKGIAPTRYESVGCDNENFSSPKELEAKGEVKNSVISVIS